MFQLIRKKSVWKWQAFGKHPSASEYLRPKGVSPLQSALCSWMEKGFEQLPESVKSEQGLAWSFWMKGPNGKMLCGRLASSCDRFGRSYPLLLIGEGACGDTTQHWDVIPFACEESWKMLSDTAQEDPENLPPLQSRLSETQAPMVEWKKYAPLREKMSAVKVVNGATEESGFMQSMFNIDTLMRNPVFSLPFDDEHFDNFHIPSYKFLTLLKTRIAAEPHMVFLGGSEEHRSLTVLKFPPRVQDFVLLWENGSRRRCGL